MDLGISDRGAAQLELAPPTYQIVATLYSGPRATLYRARRREDGTCVVLKTPRHPRATPRDVADVAHEYAVLSRLSGARVVVAVALETHRGRPWLVLDDVGGQPLDRIASRFRAPEHALRIAARIAEALAEVHRLGVVHRDVKPAHVVVLDDGSVRLSGFRIASLLRVDAAPVVQGTLAYMAPEQTGRMNRPVDKRADLYALGVLTYELLTGRRPFEGTDPLEWIHAHIAQVPVAPDEIDARVPRSASAIVLKLLSKHAEDRYHSATGLQRDLEQCADRLARGDTEDFALATDDAPDEFRVSRRLYGRETEVAKLVAGFERSRSSGSAAVSLVSGYSGVGKTSVVGALYQPIVRERGRFVSGKFDQYKRDIPYATLVQAFRDLIQDILAGGEAALAVWRDRLHAALGVNGRVVAEVIPEVELVVGPQAPVAELAPAEAQNRFEAVLLAFVRVFARSDHPLVVFLDDLQWADGATLGVLKLLARPGEVPCLQLVLAYRDNDVDEGHPFQRCIDAMYASGAAVELVPVRDLAPEDVSRLVADTLLRTRDDPAIQALAGLIRTKAGGNPFFVNELLHAFDMRRLFVFKQDLRAWVWDESALRAADVTDNVVDLLVQRLQRLPDTTRRTLEAASCFGSRFRLGTLAAVLDADAADASEDLFVALEEGLVVAVDDAIGDERTYRFHHDRIQQAAYSLLSDADRAETHLRIGRFLVGGLDVADGRLLFDVVKHLDQASSLIGDPEEREQLVALNLAAARRAKAAIAWEPARLYLEAAVGLLAEDAWSAHYRVTFDVMRELAECEFLTGHFPPSEQRFDELRRRAASRADRAVTAALQVRLYVLTGRYDHALTLGMSELEFLGESLPESDTNVGAAVAAERRRLATHLEGRDVRSIVDLPVAVDEEKRAVMTLLASLPPAIYSRRPAIFPVLAMRIVNLSLEHGNCEASCFGYSLVAMLFAAGERDINQAVALSEASIGLNERLRDPTRLGSVLHVHANHIVYWKRPYGEATALLERAYTACMDVGDLTIAGYVTFMGAWLSLEKGQSLATADQELALLEGLARGTHHNTAQAVVAIQRQFVRALTGQTTGPTTLSSDDFDAEQARERIAAAGNDTAVAMHDVLRAMLSYYHGRFAEADTWLAQAARHLHAAFCLPIEATWAFFDALTAAALWTEAHHDARPALLARVESAEARLGDGARSCPANFEARHALVAAEKARLQGRTIEAERGYEHAARAARESGLLSVEAAVMQVAVRFMAANHLERGANAWRQDCCDVLRQWGATSLVDALESAHPFVRPRRGAGPEGDDTFRARPEQLDALTAVKLSQALSREFLVEGLTQTLLRIVREHAGAERAAVLLHGDGQLRVAGASRIGAPPGGAEEPVALPESVVRYVERTRKCVVLANASEDGTFGRDPHVLRTNARSVLCMPIVLRAQLVGLLYLENGLVTGAFSPERLSLLDVICTQLAISLENARLYAEREERATDAARQAARAAQRVDLYRHFMQAAFPILVLRGPGHVIELANPAVLEVWGRTPDVVGLPLGTAVPELRDQPFLGYLDDVFRTGVTYNGQAELARVRSGPGGAIEDTYFTFVYAPLRDATDAIEGILVSAFNVTPQVLAQKESEKNTALLRDAQMQLQVVAERLGTAQRAANIGIFEWQLDSREVYWSPELYSLLGLNPDEVHASVEGWTARTVEEDRTAFWAAFHEACATHREAYELEVRLRQPDGTVRAVRLSNRLFYEQGRPTRLVGAAVDIEGLRHAAEVERAARELAERNAHFNEMFAGMLGHDLRNPLSAMVTGAALLTRPDYPPDKVAVSAARILSSGRRMTGMIDQLLDFTRIRAGGGLPLSAQDRDLAALGLRARDEIEAAVPGRQTILSQEGDTKAEVDEDRMLQVLSNLVGNAALHGAPGIPVRLLIDGRSRDEVVMTVWNAGAIASALVAVIFEPFRGGKTSGSQGLGLGLYISQQIVHAHRGTLTVRSSPEDGTLCEMRLPRKQRPGGGVVGA